MDKTGTLNCNKGQRGGYIVPTQLPFRKSKRACSENDHETWVQADSSNTLNNFDLGDTRTTHAVVYENNRRDGLRTYEGTSPTLQGFMGTGGGNVPMVNESVEVRRLTPTETERLQGFPDNYSQIPWNGKPASECPDGPRYKACGNSMAVPCMAWIGRRIQKHIEGTL
jgi:site-specific DNA-cytosine methylase